MKLVCSQSELTHALAAVAKAVPSRPSHPILISVLLQASSSGLVLTGYDLNLGIQTKIPASVSTDGVTAIPHKLLEGIASKLPSDSPLSLSLDGERLTVSSITGDYDLAASDPKDYPDFPAVTGDPIEFPSGTLRQIVKQVSFCASSDESKQVLMGVNISKAGATVKAASTDGHRLGVSACIVDEASMEDFNITIPVASMLEATKLADDSISITTDKHGQLLIKTGDTLLVTRAFNATYPQYNQLIPTSFKHTFTLNRKAFVDALSRAATIVQATNVVKLTFSEAMLSITADDQQNKGSEKLPLQNDFDGEFMVALNASYVLSATKAIATEHVVLYFNQPTTPMLVKPKDDESEGQNTDQTYLIMPVQTRA
jgi:DNA polymerase-3 subunit beta